MVLVPYPHVWFLRHDAKFFDECIKTAREVGIPLLIDGTGDIEYPIEVENAYVLRYRFLSERGRIQIPFL
jgi:hypothetical protein